MTGLDIDAPASVGTGQGGHVGAALSALMAALAAIGLTAAAGLALVGWPAPDALYLVPAISVAALLFAIVQLMRLRRNLAAAASRSIQQARDAAHGALRLARAEAVDLASHDALTGLANRRLLVVELERAIARTETEDMAFALLLVDLARLKRVNDHYGRAAGDTVLRDIARRLTLAAGKSAIVARAGGDRFAIIAQMPGEARRTAVARIGRAILAAVREPVIVADRPVTVRATIGAAIFNGERDPQKLLRAAGIALERAIHDPASISFFEPGMDEALRSGAAIEFDLRAAIADGDIQPHYQPIVDLRDASIVGFELLARWNHPLLGEVPPAVFIPLAEELGLIAELTWSVLRKGCADARAWPRGCRLSLNISPLQLRDSLLVIPLLQILSETGFDPVRLEVEVTESALVEDLPTASSVLASLRSLGVTVSLDDFGTGYSSLSHLNTLCFDKVKIDRSFVHSMRSDASSEKIVDAVLGLASSLGRPTVAEGIEDAEAAALLARKGCAFGQGYFFGKAGDAEAARAMLAHWSMPTGAE